MMLYLAPILLALPAAILAAPRPVSSAVADVIPNNWILKFKGTSPIDTIVKTVSNIAGVAPKYTYDFSSFKGLAIEANPPVMDLLKALDFVETVEPDLQVHTTSLTYQKDAPWGLIRISHRKNHSSNYFYDDTAGQGTYSYIIDSGVYIQHPDFGGRAVWGANFVTNSSNTDENGHGTHVAGTVGSTTYGVAKKTNLIAVKVLGVNGTGSISGIIQGIQWAVNDAQNKGRTGKAVINLSIGAGYSTVFNSAVRAAVDASVFVAVAAGNSNVDASTSSPASEPSACTVGATDIDDNRASFSNYGSSVDLFGPGVNVLSTLKDGTTGYYSGTSMASPHVAGLASYFLGYLSGSQNISALCARIQQSATRGAVVNPGSGSPNLLAYNGNGF